jgi:ribosomal protein S18 acetylase RimI-like enzyme
MNGAAGRSPDTSSWRCEIASRADLPDIRATYEHARATQRERSAIAWPEFADDAILREIEEQRLFRVLIDDTLAGVFSVAYDDPAIWGAHERGQHLYLHRIARAAACPSRGLVDAVLLWASEQCRALGRAGLRMDTWASNAALIEFYRRREFHLVEERRLGADPRLPPHYHGNVFALLERNGMGL